MITGANGFVGRNLSEALEKEDIYQIYRVSRDTSYEAICNYAKDCEFVFHFAAVHRPDDVREYEFVNCNYFEDILNALKKHGNKCPVLLTSSIQASNGSYYGNSKLTAERMLKEYGDETGAKTIVYRLTNTFGKWAKPNHHSVVANFCYNVCRGIPLTISDRNTKMFFYYIDDVIASFVDQILGNPVKEKDGICYLDDECIYETTLGQLADLTLFFYRGGSTSEDNIFEKNYSLLFAHTKQNMNWSD